MTEALPAPGARRYLISQHPEVEARLAAELDAAGLLVTPARPQPRPLAHADLSRLVYLNCVLKVRGSILSYFWLPHVSHMLPVYHGSCVVANDFGATQAPSNALIFTQDENSCTSKLSLLPQN